MRLQPADCQLLRNAKDADGKALFAVYLLFLESTTMDRQPQHYHRFFFEVSGKVPGD